MTGDDLHGPGLCDFLALGRGYATTRLCGNCDEQEVLRGGLRAFRSQVRLERRCFTHSIGVNFTSTYYFKIRETATTMSSPAYEERALSPVAWCSAVDLFGRTSSSIAC